MLPQVMRTITVVCLLSFIWLVMGATGWAKSNPSPIKRSKLFEIGAAPCLSCLAGYVEREQFNKLSGLMLKVEKSHSLLAKKLNIPVSSLVYSRLPSFCTMDEKLIVGLAEQWRIEKEKIRSSVLKIKSCCEVKVKAGKRRTRLPSPLARKVFNMMHSLGRVHTINMEHYKYLGLKPDTVWPRVEPHKLTMPIAIITMTERLALIEKENNAILKSYADK